MSYTLKQINDEKFLFVQQIQCHMVIQTFNQLNVLTILVPIWSAPQRRPNQPPPPFLLWSDLILLGHINNYLQWNVLLKTTTLHIFL